MGETVTKSAAEELMSTCESDRVEETAWKIKEKSEQKADTDQHPEQKSNTEHPEQKKRLLKRKEKKDVESNFNSTFYGDHATSDVNWVATASYAAGVGIRDHIIDELKNVIKCDNFEIRQGRVYFGQIDGYCPATSSSSVPKNDDSMITDNDISDNRVRSTTTSLERASSLNGYFHPLNLFRSAERVSLIAGRWKEVKNGMSSDDIVAMLKAGIANFAHSLRLWQDIHGRSPKSFRVKCKRSGLHTKDNCRSMDVEARFAGIISSTYPYLNISLGRGDFDVELNVLITDEEVLFSIPLYKQNIVSVGPKSSHAVGLSQPVCFALAKSGELDNISHTNGDKSNDESTNSGGNLTVLDPMCGCGTILLEAAVYWPDCQYIGIDKCEEQMKKCLSNCENRALDVTLDESLSAQVDQHERGNDGIQENRTKKSRTKVELHLGRFNGHAQQKVDVVLCDLPYGKQFGSLEENQTLYPEFCRFLKKVLKPETGRFALITSNDNLALLSNGLVEVGLRIKERRPLNLGFMKACIIVGDNQEDSSDSAIPPFTSLLSWEKSGGRHNWESTKLSMRGLLVPSNNFDF